MGVNKLGTGNKDFDEGYAAGFAAGVAASFAATGDVSQKFSNNVPVSITDTGKADEGSKDLSTVTGDDLNLPQQETSAEETSTVAVNVSEESARLATVPGEALDPSAASYTPESSMVDSAKLEEKSAHSTAITEELIRPYPGHHALEPSMESEKLDEDSECLAAVTYEELNLSYPRSSALKSRADVVKIGGDDDRPDVVSEEDLSHIVPGCFVRVGSGETSYWVEIGQIEGTTISGMVHPELSTSLCVIDHDSCEIARFRRDQITALGCDRYCWC
jgi:hypothetical protein